MNVAEHIVDRLRCWSAHRVYGYPGDGIGAAAALACTTHPTWTFDLTGVSFRDAEGLRSLVRARGEAVRRGNLLQLVGCSSFLRRLLPLVDLQQHVVHAMHTPSLAEEGR